MSEVDRFSSEFPGSLGGFMTPGNPPSDSPDPFAAGSAPPPKPRSRLWPRLLAVGVTVGVLAVTGAVFLRSNTATAGPTAVLSATAPIAAVTRPASAYSGSALLTNNHVVEGATSISVTIAGRSAELAGLAPYSVITDVA